MGKNKRKIKLEEEVKIGIAYCNKHKQYLTLKELYKKKCWLSRTSKYCKYYHTR